MLTKLQLYGAMGLIVLILLSTGYGLYKYQERRADRLEEQNAALALGQQIILEAQEATKKFNQGKVQEQRRSADEQAQIDTVVETKDDAAMRGLYIKQGMLQAK